MFLTKTRKSGGRGAGGGVGTACRGAQRPFPAAPAHGHHGSIDLITHDNKVVPSYRSGMAGSITKCF